MPTTTVLTNFNINYLTEAQYKAKLDNGTIQENDLYCTLDTDNKFCPVGKIVMYPGTTIPSGWKLCDGSPLDKTTYSVLFSIIGYIYGGSDDTFNLPDFRGYMPLGVSSSHPLSGNGSTGGEETVKLTDVQMAHGHGFTQPSVTGGSHTHTVNNQSTTTYNTPNGDYYGLISKSTGNYTGYDGGHTHTVSGGAVANLSGASSTRTAHNNMPPYRSTNFIIYTGVYS